MPEKLKLTNEQVDAISNFTGMVGLNGTMKHHIDIMTTTGYQQAENKSLNNISIPNMARILYEANSYEIISREKTNQNKKE